MNYLEPLISSENVDAVFINDKYQDETKPLRLDKNEIDSFQSIIFLHTSNNVKIEIRFHSVKDLMDFVKAYELKWE